MHKADRTLSLALLCSSEVLTLQRKSAGAPQTASVLEGILHLVEAFQKSPLLQ